MTVDEAKALVKNRLSEKRYKHTINVKKMAVKLAKRYGALFLMGTATPDFISYYKAKQGEFLLLELKERTGGGVLPRMLVTDMRKELAEGNRSAFGRALQEEIRRNLEKGEQTMLFLNRRGYATFVSCRSCGHVMKCPECDLTYTYHAKEHALACHYCGRRAPLPKVCPVCGSKYIRYFGTGTQKIEEEAKKLFPEARILRMDLDTTLTKHSHETILAAFAAGEADILIGTQMIAKGHDYPNVTLVGVMAADLSLNADSFTAAETGFRLMLQAAGRAGRRDDRGRVFLQTYQPQHYAVQYAAKQDYQGFYEEEMLMRQMMGYPPFSAFFSILLTGEAQEGNCACFRPNPCGTAEIPWGISLSNHHKGGGGAGIAGAGFADCGMLEKRSEKQCAAAGGAQSDQSCIRIVYQEKSWYNFFYRKIKKFRSLFQRNSQKVFCLFKFWR